MAEREWAGRWAGGSLPNDINNILYWVATAGRGSERSEEEGGKGSRAKEWGLRKKKGNGWRENLRRIEETVCGGQGVTLSADLARRKIRKRSIDRRQGENKQDKIMRKA